MTIAKRYVPLFKGIDQTTRRLPVIAVDSGAPGPVVCVSAAIHGDEVTGTAVIQSLVKRLKTFSLVKGKLYAFPILNPSGFENISRSVLYDKADVNRNFGGSDGGNAAERFASIISSTIIGYKPDYVIDLHTDSMNSIAYTLIDYPDCVEDVTTIKKSVQIARTLGFSWAIDTDMSAGYPLQHCLTGYLVSQGIPAVTIELGGPLVVSDRFRRVGLEAVWGFLYSQGMVESEAKRRPIIHQDQVYTFQHRIHTGVTGIIDFRVAAGGTVKAGQILGIIRNVYGETTEIVRSPADGILFSHEDQSVVFPGLNLFTLASPSDSKRFTRLT